IMGAGVASGMTGAEIADYARASLGRRGEVARRIWSSRPGSLREAVAGGFRVGQFDLPRILKSFLPETVPATFEELSIPLKLTGTDYYGHSVEVMETGDLLSAIAASAAIPAVFRPVMRNGRLLIDGGLFNPVPFDLVDGMADIVVAIDVVGSPEQGDRAPTAIELMFGASQLMMQSINTLKLAQRRPDVFLQPPVSKFRVLDFLKIDAVMADTQSLKDEVKRELSAAIDARQKPH
ncbi:MAG: patatin-like phospholipase family protein, partial [Mesorhizobium sp.]